MWHTWLWLGLLAITTSASTDFGTFQNTSNHVRPKFRYWLPDPSVDTATVQDDIKRAATIGAGGIEFLPLYNYGGDMVSEPKGADWATYGFGTKPFNDMFRAALEAAKEAGLLMDFAIGASQGQGVPANVTDEGLQWDLAPFNVTVSNGSFNGIIPGWGTGDLVALVSAQVLASSTITNAGNAILGAEATNSTLLTLKESSLRDWTSHVAPDGKASLQFNATSEHKLFAFYQWQTLAKNVDIQSNATGTFWDNGSYTVDHFSGRGANVTIDFWRNYILNSEGIGELLAEVGNLAWEDSLEIKSNVSWTPSLPSMFRALHGYNIHKYLPLMIFGNNNPGLQPSTPGTIKCILEDAEKTMGYVNDFRATLVQGYREYLQTLTNWAENELGLKIVPECESLAFEDKIDSYRQFSGSANVAGKPIISNEMGANYGKSFALPARELLGEINRAMAGGVNQIVLHGQTYTGNFYETTWPGYTAFFFLFSESYMNKQPAWENGYADWMTYVGRNQFILRHGQPRTDVAVYNKQSETDANLEVLYQSSDMVDAGYTYTYLSPDNFDLAQMTVTDGMLAAGSPAYRAMVVTSEQNVTLAAVDKLKKYAQDGLPVILSGGDPGYYASGNGSSEAAVKAAIAELKQTANVHSTGKGEIASKLNALGINPRVRVATNGTWYPVLRTDSSTDYVFLFADGKASSGYIEVEITKSPYILNAWTGVQQPVLEYRRLNSSIIVPLRLGANQTVILAFDDSRDTPSLHATHLPSSAVGYEYSSHGLTLQVAASGHGNLTLSSGKSMTISKKASPSFALHNWSLVAEHWEAPSNLSDASIIASKRNTTHALPGLVSWLDIPALANASGIGYYTTSFNWTASDGDGAYIHLPPISQGLRLHVNSHLLPPLDYNQPKADLRPYLVTGVNQITAVVPTMMWNYIRSIYDELEVSGSPPLLTPLPGRVDNGLIGEVRIIPYSNITV
ncbi:hypothetical protein ASPWEDRAFT_191821 [Aspergillus wentii DTO 134E9]|uniref:Secreted protein n=1 Tax=Aspergillus wentii DTO 134E9 TaxID=1073089 RepID=A0A1L9RYU2_ASPWE|nr:uncharacterized protein ASPWEDRAFT_191821 [Aspergillus wentii DTO 134E9]OJJ40082.1 hypothetical protein ASPWEDRAFT_191821 [Aspergillus wentii DTO 134E9]